MMKRYITLALVALSLSAYTYFGGSNCPTKSEGAENGGSKNLTCGSCHATSVVGGGDIFIDGKTLDEDVIEFEVNFPSELSALSLEMFVDDDGRKSVSTTTTANPEIYNGLGTQFLFELIQMKSSKKQAEIAPVTFLWKAPQNFKEPRTITVTGLLSNMDGTVEGDFSFEKKIVVDPSIFADKVNASLSIYPTVAESVVNITGFSKKSTIVRVVNILGKTVFQSSVAKDAALAIDVTQFENGNYFVMVGEGASMETLRFVVKK